MIGIQIIRNRNFRRLPIRYDDADDDADEADDEADDDAELDEFVSISSSLSFPSSILLVLNA
jgi:hypothetical protein